MGRILRCCIIQKLKPPLNKPRLSNIIISRYVYMGTKLNVSLQEVKVKSLCFAKEGNVLAPSIVITLDHLSPRQTDCSPTHCSSSGTQQGTVISVHAMEVHKAVEVFIIPQSALRHIHNIFQSDYSTDCYIVLPLSNCSTFSFKVTQ